MWVGFCLFGCGGGVWVERVGEGNLLYFLYLGWGSKPCCCDSGMAEKSRSNILGLTFRKHLVDTRYMSKFQPLSSVVKKNITKESTPCTACSWLALH